MLCLILFVVACPGGNNTQRVDDNCEFGLDMCAQWHRHRFVLQPFMVQGPQPVDHKLLDLIIPLYVLHGVEYIVEYDQPIELKLKALDRLSKQEITTEITARINRQKDILELASQAQNAVAEMSSTRDAPSTQAKAAGKGMGR